MITLKSPGDDSPTSPHNEQKDAPTKDNYDWEDPKLQLIDWGKVEFEGEPYDGPPIDISGYSDIVDVSKFRKHKDATGDTESDQ